MILTPIYLRFIDQARDDLYIICHYSETHAVIGYGPRVDGSPGTWGVRHKKTAVTKMQEKSDKGYQSCPASDVPAAMIDGMIAALSKYVPGEIRLQVDGRLNVHHPPRAAAVPSRPKTSPLIHVWLGGRKPVFRA